MAHNNTESKGVREETRERVHDLTRFGYGAPVESLVMDLTAWSVGLVQDQVDGRKNVLQPLAASPEMGKPWSQDDLFSSAQLLSVGVPIDHVAAYLKRTVAEVEATTELFWPISLQRRSCPLSRTVLRIALYG